MSYIEKTARKLYPILQELKKRMVPEKKRINSSARSIKRKQRGSKEGKVVTLDPHEDEDSEHDQLLIDFSQDKGLQGLPKVMTDMKNILGYLNQGEWTSKLSIGSIM